MDFDIQNNVLKKYEGSDSSVIIPQGVTEIGYAAFYKGTTDEVIGKYKYKNHKKVDYTEDDEKYFLNPLWTR